MTFRLEMKRFQQVMLAAAAGGKKVEDWISPGMVSTVFDQPGEVCSQKILWDCS